MRSFSFLERGQMLKDLESEIFDLVVIGGGITGAGVARDAASRGMKVALLEAQDFAQGTSSRSSKLIHGGIRYLENYEFGLVFEALSERRLLFDLAPHLVHPLRFVLPLFKGDRVGMFKMGLGMWAYDALSMFEAPEMHEHLSATESLDRIPLLRQTGLLGSYVYSDAYMDDDRLVIETLRSAHKLGAVCVSRVRADNAEFKDGRVAAIGAHDVITGNKLKICGKHFVSSVGPWTDQVANQLLGSWHKLLRPSKGVHLTFDRSRLPLSQAVVMAADQQKRIVFAIPRHEMIIIGTTDTDFPSDPADVLAKKEDVDYLLNVAREYFPGAKLEASDIIATYSGVRPLVDDGAETESKTSREHVIVADPRGVTFVAGGKYTTYRHMAEDTVKKALESYSLEDQVRFARSQTKVALNPGATPALLEEAIRSSLDWAREFGVSPEATLRLAERHGQEAYGILSEGRDWIGARSAATVASATSSSGDGAPVGWLRELWCLEARHSVHHAMCFHLVDYYTRRAPLFLSLKDHGLSLIDDIAQVFAGELSWDQTRVKAEIQGVRDHITRELGWQKDFGL